MKVHLGCGSVYLKGYINVDGAPDYFAQSCPLDILELHSTTYDKYYKQEFGSLPKCVVADIKHNISEKFPFENNSIEEIILYHVLEHLPQYDVGKLISEISRVLKVGGTFLVAVPDVKETAKLLAKAKTEEEEDWVIRLIHGTQRNQWSHHFCGYVPRTLKNLLSNYGFGNFQDMPSINFYPAIHIKALKEK